MTDPSNVFLFLFYWSVLVIIRTVVIAITSIFGKEPKPIKMSKTELILNSITFSYIITYLTT
jgi:hypothetical protein